MPIILICLMLTCVGLGAFAWQRHRKYDNKTYPLRVELAILDVALLMHEAALLMPVLWDSVLIMGFGYSASLVVWLMLMMYCLGSFFYCLHGLQLLLCLRVTIAPLLRWVFPGKFVGYQINDLPFMLHIISSLLACGLFGVVALFVVLILLLNHNLRRRRASALSSFLPPLLSLEKLMFRSILVGFVLLTYSVASGTFLAESVLGKSLTFTRKTIFSVLSRLAHGGLLLKHSMTVWRGEEAAVWTTTDFVSLLLAHVGSKLVLEIVLYRQERWDGGAVWRA